MTDTELASNGRVPTLVQLCQRAAVASVDSINTLGDLSYPLVKPILERCSVEQLLKLEEASPHLQGETLEIWMQSCIRKYPTAVEKYLDDDLLEPFSWRDRYMVLKREEELRLEQLGSKLRTQRLEAEERKKEREVKLTDRVPPAKRQRTGWGAPVQPKSLLQKTLSEASKIQRAMYTSRIIPPMNNGKSYRVLPKPSCPIMPTPQSNVPSRVSVTTVVQKRPMSGPSNKPSSKTMPISVSLSSSPLHHPSSTKLSSSTRPPSGTVARASPPVPAQSESPSLKRPAVSPNASGDTRPFKPVSPMKKDPMASLFVPKHRAYSQRPV